MNIATEHHSARDRQVRRVVVVEGLANLAVLLVKLAVGAMTGSLAVLADAIHSLTDVANNVIAYFVLRLSSAPPDREHPYGHRKFETLAVFGLASLLTVLAIELVLHAWRREPTEIAQTGWGLGLMLGVLAVNISLALWQRGWARRLDSDLLLADASHTFADVLTTIVVIVGWQLSTLGYQWLDTLCALGVAGLVFYLAWGLFRRAVPVLVDGLAVDPELLEGFVRDVPGVEDIRRVRSRWQGSERAVDMVVTVEPSLSTRDAHDIADAIEAALAREFQIDDVHIHVEPHRQRG